MICLLLSLGFLAVAEVSAIPNSWEGDGLLDYIIIQEDSYPGEPASRLKVDDCSDHAGAGDDTSYWCGAEDTVMGDPDMFTMRLDYSPSDPSTDTITSHELILRNSNCGSYNDCGVKDFKLQVPDARKSETGGNPTFPTTDTEALEWNWVTVVSGSLPDPRNVTCADRDYYSFSLPKSDGPHEVYVSYNKPVGYVRFVATNWYGSYPSLEFLGLNSEELMDYD